MKKLYTKIVNVLSGIPTDKYIHCVVSMILSSVFMHIVPLGIVLRYLFSVNLTIIVGVAKELYDKRDYGLFDRKDILANIIGAILGALMAI